MGDNNLWRDLSKTADNATHAPDLTQRAHDSNIQSAAKGLCVQVGAEIVSKYFVTPKVAFSFHLAMFSFCSLEKVCFFLLCFCVCVCVFFRKESAWLDLDNFKTGEKKKKQSNIENEGRCDVFSARQANAVHPSGSLQSEGWLHDFCMSGFCVSLRISRDRTSFHEIQVKDLDCDLREE